MARVTAIIPARLASKRFSRKVLHPLNNKPLIYHVWKSVGRSRLIDRIFVATDSVEIARAVNDFGGAVIMTSARPRNGTERAAEAVADLGTDLVINVQADNLGLTGAVLDRVIKAMLSDKSITCATLARKIEGRDWKKKLENSNVVKVIGSSDGHALWFSRHPIPYIQQGAKKRAIDLFPFLEHIGVYFFRKKALLDYAGQARGRAEAAESLEQLRIIEHGGRIKLFTTRVDILSVDSKKALKNLRIKL